MIAFGIAAVLSLFSLADADTPTCQELQTIRSIGGSQSIDDLLLDTAVSAYIKKHENRIRGCFTANPDLVEDSLEYASVVATQGLEEIYCRILGTSDCSGDYLTIWGGSVTGETIPPELRQSFLDIVTSDPGVTDDQRADLMAEFETYWEFEQSRLRLVEPAVPNVLTFQQTAPAVDSFYQGFTERLEAGSFGLSDTTSSRLQGFLLFEAPVPEIRALGAITAPEISTLRPGELEQNMNQLQQQLELRAAPAGDGG